MHNIAAAAGDDTMIFSQIDKDADGFYMQRAVFVNPSISLPASVQTPLGEFRQIHKTPGDLGYFKLKTDDGGTTWYFDQTNLFGKSDSTSLSPALL